MEDVPLIDISFEDDLLIPSLQEFGTHASLKEEKTEKVMKNWEDFFKLSNSPEKKQKRSDRHHLRKSLAWNSAFFTNEGILNSEEMAMMNSTYNKSGIILPGIQEELIKSSESITLESDSRPLEHLEVNLLENVRASVRKTLNKSNNSRKMVDSVEIKEQKKPDAPRFRSLEKIDISSQIKLKPSTASRRYLLTRKQQEHISKNPLTCMSVENRESKPLIKLAKGSCKGIILPASVPGKQASMEMKEIKNSTNKILSGAVAKHQSSVAFNKSIEYPGMTRRTTVSTKCKTLKSSSRNEYSRGIHRPNLVSSSLCLSKASPSSSVDTLDSGSSTCTTSVYTKLGKSIENSDVVGSFTPALAYSSSLGISKYSGSLSQSSIYDQNKSSVNNDSGARLAKPSGLRMPSPTVGYFDKEKSLVHGSIKVPKPTLQINLPKNTGLNLIAGTNKLRPINLPAVRDKGVTIALSKQVLKSSKVQEVPTKCGNPKVNEVSSETARNNLKTDLEDDEDSREHVPNGDDGTHSQSHEIRFPEEDGELGKDNAGHLKIEGQSEPHQIEDQCAGT